MTLKEADDLKKAIRDVGGLHCVVPRGHGPNGYFARVITSAGPLEFHTHLECVEALLMRLRHLESEQSERARLALELVSRPRSPIEIMIDRACGVE